MPTPKPIEQKRRTGNPGKRPLPDPAAVIALAPIEAEVVGRQASTEVVAEVLARGVGWIAETDAPAVALLVEAVEDYALLRDAYFNGERGTGAVKFSDLRDARKQVMDLLGRLGFDPAARAQLGVAEVTIETKLDKLRRKRAGDTP